MNKKIKNIASVVQTKSAAVLCTLCAVLFLASCTDESLVDNPHAQNALRTVSVDLGMPQDKPAFGEGTTSRADLGAQTVEILLGDSTLAVSRAESAEGGTESSSPSGSESTTPTWVDGDQILVKIDAGSTQGRLTLQYIDPAAIPASASGEEPQTATAGWYLMKDISYVKYTGDAFTAYNAQGVTPMIAGDTSDNADKLAIGFTQPLTLHLDWTASQPTVSIIYAPYMEWSLAGGNVSMEQKNSATAAITAPELWTVAGNAWTTNQARLRVNTGTGNAGDVVTLTSSAFDSAWEVEPTVGEGENKKTVFTAVTDDYGDAYFYGATVDAQGNPSALTDGFLVQLTKMRVHVSGQGETAVYTTLNTNVTLLEASDVVPVTLTATMAYKLVMSADKRNATTQTVLSVIDGQATSVATVKAQIETAVAMDIYDFTVINQLARDYDPNEAETVVGQAIHDLASDESSPNYGKISITIADATELSSGAFYKCYALKSVTFNQPVAIGGWVFSFCTALTGVDWAKVTKIGGGAFTGCTFTGPITINEGVTVDAAAFSGANVSNCDLVLPAGQVTGITISNGKLMWAGAEWASITLLDGPNGTAGTKYTIENGVPTVEVDGTIGGKTSIVADDVTAMNSKIKVVADVATTNVPAKVIVKNELAAYTNGTENDIYAGTVVGEAIRLLTPELQPMGTETVNYNGRITLTLDNATELPEIAFAYCNALQNVSAPNATEIGPGAFILCTALTSVSLPVVTNIGKQAFALSGLIGELSLPAATTIGTSAFQSCTGLTSVSLPNATTIADAAFVGTRLTGELSLPAATTIGTSAFQSCTGLTSVSLPNATTIRGTAFQGCAALTTVLFGTAVKGLGDMAFDGVNTIGCSLTLAVGQQDTEYPVTAENGKLMWAGEQWQSITVGGVKYAAKGNELYAVIDGRCGITSDNPVGNQNNVNTVMAQIQAVPANTKILVTYGLAAYSNTGSAGTVVGEAIRLLTSQAMPPNTSEEDYIGRISLVLDDGITEIPDKAFMGCKELGSVVANGVTTIGIGAFYECTGIKELTFGKVITEVGNDAFGLAPRDNGYCWSNKCVLTLKSGQLLLTFDSSSYKYTSQGSEQQVQAGTDIRWCGTAWTEIKLVSNTPQPI